MTEADRSGEFARILAENRRYTDAFDRSALTAAPLSTVEAVRESLIRQMTAPVLFEASIRNMIAAGVRSFVQCGPGRGLTVFARAVDASVACATFPDAVASRGAVTL